MYALFQVLCRVIFRAIGKPKIIGLKNVPEGPFVLAANHQSILDPLVLIACIPHPVMFLAASYIFKIPVVGRLVQASGALPVKDGQESVSSAKRCLSQLYKGGVVGLFPEGGVSLDGRLKPFRSGWAYFALKTGVPVLPVAIFGSRNVLPVGKYFPRRGRIRVSIGETIPVGRRPRIRRGDLEELNRKMAITINRLLSDCEKLDSVAPSGR